MTQRIYLHPWHRFLWFPIFGNRLLTTFAIWSILLLLAPIGVLALPSLTAIKNISSLQSLFITAGLFGLSVIIWRNRAFGHYYSEFQTFLKVLSFTILVFILYFLMGFWQVQMSAAGAGTSWFDLSKAFKDSAATNCANASAATFVAASFSAFWPQFGTQIHDLGSQLKVLMATLNEPLSLARHAEFSETELLISRCAELLDKVSQLKLSADACGEVARLEKCISEIGKWFSSYNRTAIYLGSPAIAQLRRLAAKLSGEST